MTARYRVNEVFYSVQGEGMRAGEASVFLRLTGCNMRCRVEPGPKSPGGFDCDTEFTSGRDMTAAEVAQACVAEAPKDAQGMWVVCTGGEPLLQLDTVLVDALRDAGFRVAVETNGSIAPPCKLDWLTVSPKVAEHAIRAIECDEVKYVRGYGQAVPRTVCRAQYRLLSPATDGLRIDPRAVAWCVQLVKENPAWRLSVQMHKDWMVR